MGVFAKKGDQEEPGGGGGSGLHMDLDERFCVTCRRALQPWQTTCPDDGGKGVALTELPSAMPPPPAHLLADDDWDAEDTAPDDATEPGGAAADGDGGAADPGGADPP